MSASMKSVSMRSVSTRSVSNKSAGTDSSPLATRAVRASTGPIDAVRRPIAWACLSLVGLALAGCVGFEQAPVDTLSCDPDLPGLWNLKADGMPAKTIRIDAQCHTDDWPGLREQPVALDLTGFVLGRNRYIVIAPADAERAIGADRGIGAKPRSISELMPKDGVFLVLYRIDGDQANVWLASPDMALSAIAQGRLQGRKLDDRFALIQTPAAPPAGKLDDQPPLIRDAPQRLRMVLGEQAEWLFATDQKSMTLTRVNNETVAP